MSFEDEKQQLAKDLAELERERDRKSRRLKKLEAVQDLLGTELEPGTVIRFSRTLAGSRAKYTFVAFRSGPYKKSWHLTGKANALRLLGLSEGANTWEDLVIAIGDAKVKVASEWVDPGQEPDGFEYYQSANSTRLYRVHKDLPTQVERLTTKGWERATLFTRSYLTTNPGSFPQVTKREILSRLP